MIFEKYANIARAAYYSTAQCRNEKIMHEFVVVFFASVFFYRVCTFLGFKEGNCIVCMNNWVSRYVVFVESTISEIIVIF